LGLATGAMASCQATLKGDPAVPEVSDSHDNWQERTAAVPSLDGTSCSECLLLRRRRRDERVEPARLGTCVSSTAGASGVTSGDSSVSRKATTRSAGSVHVRVWRAERGD
jgi:hypothetical protein